MSHRPSKWTQIYWDIDPEAPKGQKFRPYVRLVPFFMDIESTGFPHGVGLAGFFPDLEAANKFADRVDAFMDVLVQSFKESEVEQDDPSYVSWLKGGDDD